MRAETYPLEVVATTGTGAAQTVAELADKWVQVSGLAGGAVVQLEGTINGNGWVVLSAGAISADGLYEVPEGVAKIRTNRTTTGSGTPTVHLLGRLSNTD